MRGLADTLGVELADELDGRLAAADRALARQFPGPRSGRQPVHTVYVPADRFDRGLAATWGAVPSSMQARRSRAARSVASSSSASGRGP